MYEVRIINGEDTTIINEVDVSFNANRITGEGVEGINTINSFTFYIYPNNSGYELLHELTTLVEVENTITEKICFKGRVYKTIPGMEESGLHYKKVVCEDEKAFLHDSIQHYVVFQNAIISDVLNHVLEVHNMQVEDHKKIYLGKCEIEVTDGVSLIVSYQDTYDLIMNDIVAEYGGEIVLRYEDGQKYLDYLVEMGKYCVTDIRLGKNLQKFEEEREPSDIVTVLYPLGAKIAVVNEDGESETTEERLTIESVNNSNPFLIDQVAKAKYGVITRTIIFDGIIDANDLMEAGDSYLKKNNKIISSYILAALDLALIGIDHETIEMGNYYPVIIPTMNVDEELRVIEKRFSIDNPENPTFVIGEKANDIKNIHKEALEIPSIKTEISEIVKGQKEFALQMSRATGMYHSEVKQEDGSTIIYFHDKPTMIKSTRIISVNSEGIGVSPDAGVTWYGFTIDGKFIADQLLTNKLTAEHIEVDSILVGIRIEDGTGKTYWDLATGEFVANNLSVGESISTETLYCDKISNEAYPEALTSNITVYINSDSGDDDAAFENGTVFQTLQGCVNRIPKFLNGYTVYIEFQTDLIENVSVNFFTAGRIFIYLAGHTLYGYLYSAVCPTLGLYGGTKSGGGTDLTGTIHPATGVNIGGYTASVGISYETACYMSNLKVIGSDNLVSGTSNRASVATQFGITYGIDIEIANTQVGFRANAAGRIYLSSSSGVASIHGSYATSGGHIALNSTKQAGGNSANTHENDGGTVKYHNPTFESGDASSSDSSASTTKVAKNVTYTSSKGNAIQYYGTSSAKWRSDNTPKVGTWGYGNHVAFWFFGDKFENVADKDVTKIEITFTRNSGGNSAATLHNFYVHNYESQPSTVKPSYDSTKIASASVKTGNSAMMTITDSALISKIIKSKGICSIPPSQSTTYYSVMSGSMKVKFYYTE